MKINCEQNALAEAVGIVGGVIATRTPTPVLQCIRLTADANGLTLAATDLEIGLCLSIDQVEVIEEGECLIPADRFVRIIRSWVGPTVTLETQGHNLHMTSENAHFKVFGFDASEAPAIAAGGPDGQCTIAAGILKGLISRTIFAAAQEHTRFAINGVLFDRTDCQLRLVATDGRRLALATGTCDTGTGEASRIIPTKALSLVSRLLLDPESTVHISIEDNQVVFYVDDGSGHGATLSSSLVEGTFPPFEDVIPEGQDKRVTFDTGELNSAIRRAALLTNEESRGVRLVFSEKNLTLTSRAPEMGEAEIQIPTPQYEGDDLEIGFNPDYITDALKVIDSPEVIIELKAANKPGVIRMGRDFTYVIMPVNLQ
jgi:DNA polymerase-3 subunit beta